MTRKSFLFTLIALLTLMLGVAGATAQEPQQAGNGGCAAGATYDPACDVNRDGNMSVVDLELVANHWGQEGTWTSDFWSLTGNAGTDPATNFLGTTDEQPLVIKTNGAEAMRVTTGGNVGIGTDSPITRLDVDTGGVFLLSGVRVDAAGGHGVWVDSAGADGVRVDAAGGFAGNFNGAENDGTNAALKITSGSQNMLLDGNEIDALSGKLHLNRNSAEPVTLARGGGNVGIGTDSPFATARLHVQSSDSGLPDPTLVTAVFGEATTGTSPPSVGVWGDGFYGVLGRSDNSTGAGVRGSNSSTSGKAYGVWGTSDSTAGAGVYAQGKDSGADLILAGNANTGPGDDGRIFSDPNYSSSDIWLITNDAVAIKLDNDGDGEDADFLIRDKDDNNIFVVDESGTTTIKGGGTGVSAAALYAESTDTSAGEPAGIAIYGLNHSGDATIVAHNTGAGDLFRGLSPAGDRVVFAVRNNGTTSTRVLEITGGADLAEPFEIAGAEAIEPGMVVAIDPEHPGQLRIADKAYDRTVAGCVSGANGVNPGLIMQQEGSVADGALPVALSGRVYCWADASYGPIQPGDLLTTSDRPGYAMAVTDYARAQGAILGKAMTRLEKGKTGLVLVLVSLQ